MALKLILFLIIIYFIGKTIGNLFRAVVADSKLPPRAQQPPYQQPRSREPEWTGPVPRQERRSRGEVEDAKWVDLP